MNKIFRRYIILLLIFFSSVSLSIYIISQNKKPVRIGYIGYLSGPLSDSGILVLNGVQLAVSEINNNGGIKGREVELHIKDAFRYLDDLTIPIDELIEENVTAVIGPELSVLAVKLVPIINEKKILLISPWVTTDLLSGKDDYFFRVMMGDKAVAEYFSTFLYDVKGWRSITAVFDLSNRAYSEGFCIALKDAFEKLGGSLDFIEPYSTGNGIDRVVDNLLKSSSKVVLIAGTANDTARICQDLRKNKSDQFFIASDWAMHENLIFEGGLAVENLLIPTQYFADQENIEFIGYSEKYKLRFDKNPSSSDSFGYDAAFALFDTLKKNNKWDSENLKESILEINEFKGSMGLYKIDNFGDAERHVKIIAVKNGEFTEVK